MGQLEINPVKNPGFSRVYGVVFRLQIDFVDIFVLLLDLRAGYIVGFYCIFYSIPIEDRVPQFYNSSGAWADMLDKHDQFYLCQSFL